MSEFSAETPKEEIYRDILTKEFEGGELPQAIFVLSGGTDFHKNQGFRSPSYSGADFTGLASGSRMRVIAADEIGKIFPDVTLVTTGKTNEPGFPNDARVLADELVERGTSPEQIMLEEKSVSVLTELVQMVKMAIEKEWQRVAAITNDYHVPRVKVMYQKLETIEGLCNEEEIATILEFKQEGGQVSVVSAEDILSVTSDHYKALIEKAESTDAYRARVESEEKGIQDLLNGTYKVRR